MRTVNDIGEFGLIERIQRLLPTSPAVIEGIGDDCAVLRIFDRLMVVSCDQAIEGVHFRTKQVRASDIGWKAAASSLSDIAAMGATPMFALVALACPPETEVPFIEGLYQGIASIMSQYSVSVVGGDTCHGPHIALDITVIGAVRGNRYLRRTGSESGDLLVVSGDLGEARAGLHALEHGHDAPEAIAALYRPNPRILEGQWLCGVPSVHAMLDISDGLFQDAGHLVEVNQLGVNLHREALNVSPTLDAYCTAHGLDPVETILAGGEDYELAFSIKRNDYASVLESFHQEFRTPLRVVGEFTDEWTGVRVDGQESTVHGYDHFHAEPDDASQSTQPDQK